MQICPKCNTTVEDNANFCSSCGNQMKFGQPVCATPVYTAPAPAANVQHPSRSVLNVVKKFASSPLFLVAVIAYSAQIIFTLVNSPETGAKVEIILYQLLNSLGGSVPYKAYEFAHALSKSGNILYVMGAILSQIPLIFICAGLWMTYSSAKQCQFDEMSTAGLTIIKVITIIQITFTCLAFAGVEIILLLAVIGIALTAYAPGTAIAVMVLWVLLTTAAYILQIIYSANIIKSINVAKKTITKGEPVAKVSSFVAIWSFVLAFCTIFCLEADFLGSTATITYLVCFGILIYKYNSSIKSVAVSTETEEQVYSVK